MSDQRYHQLSHGPCCRRCGAMVGDTVDHDRWHQQMEEWMNRVAKDAREGAGIASLHRPLGGSVSRHSATTTSDAPEGSA